MLPEGDYVHTFRNDAVGMIVGAEATRGKIVAELKDANSIELSGRAASGMNHGLAVWCNDGWLFVATRPDCEKDADGRILGPPPEEPPAGGQGRLFETGTSSAVEEGY